MCARPCSVPGGYRSQWLLTQVELGAVALRYWTLVHISRLLVAIGFQWGTHNQPVKGEKRSQVVGGAFLPSEAGPGGDWGRRNGVEDFPMREAELSVPSWGVWCQVWGFRGEGLQRP